MQLVTWFLTCLLFAHPAQQPANGAGGRPALALTAAAAPTPPPPGPNDFPPILP